MIASLAYAGIVYKNEVYVKRARESMDFLIENSLDKKGNLLSTHIDGNSYNLAYLEDYSFFIYGLINLYKATEDDKYLELAKNLMEDTQELFGDDNNRGLFFYGNKSEELILRPKDYYDGAIPSGNSFTIIDLMNLYVITKEEEYYNIAREILYSFGGNLTNNPVAHLFSVIGMNNFI